MKSRAKKTVKTVINVILWIFLIFAICITIFAFSSQAGGKEYPKFGDKCLLSVRSGSMAVEGGFYKNDLIVCTTLSEEDKANLGVGDVITFYVDLDGDGVEELNTHRIVEVLESGKKFKTKGDNNSFEDNYEVSANKIEALWAKAGKTGTRIAGIGGVIAFFQSSLGFLLCIVLPLAAFFIYEIVVLVITIGKVKNKDKKIITKEEEELIKQRAVEEYLKRQAELKTDGDKE